MNYYFSNRKAFIFISLLAFSLLSSCKNSKNITEESQQNEETKVENVENKMLKAVMLDYSAKAEGCEFLIQLEENNELLQFLELADEYKVDGKKIWIRFTRSRRQQGPCPLGTPIIIEEIKSRN